MIENQKEVLYPYAFLSFKGQIYKAPDIQKIQQTLPIPYPIALQQKDEITKKHPFKRVTRMALCPLAIAFDVVTVAPSLRYGQTYEVTLQNRSFWAKLIN